MTTGLMFLPFSVTMIVAADRGLTPGAAGRPRQARRRSARRSPRSRCSASAGSRTTTGSATLGVDISYWTDIFPFVVLMPIGMSLVFIPMTMSVVHGVSPADSGIASGVLNTMQQVGGALGLATLSTIALNAAAAKADRRSAAGSRLRARRATTRCCRASRSPTAPSVGFLALSAMLLVGGVDRPGVQPDPPRGPGGRRAPVGSPPTERHPLAALTAARRDARRVRDGGPTRSGQLRSAAADRHSSRAVRAQAGSAPASPQAGVSDQPVRSARGRACRGTAPPAR